MTKRSVFGTIYLIATLLLVCSAFAQKQETMTLKSAIANAHGKIETDTRSYFRNIESFIVSSKGRIIFEQYYYGASKDSLHITQSQTKSIVALLLGIAIDKGYVRNDDECIARYFSDYFDPGDDAECAIRIRDVLTMSAGMRWEEMLPFNDPRNDNITMFRSGNWLHYVLTRPLLKKQTTGFKYNSGCPMIIAGIIQKTTGMTLDEFAQKHLFAPLGIEKFSWQKDSTGFCHAGGGLFLKPVDMIKIGELVLHKGKWGNVQVVSESWIRKATQPYFATTFNGYSYGYFWWVKKVKINETTTTTVISAQGAGGQYLYVFPEYDLVVAFTEHNYGTPLVGPFIVENYLVPALE
jgi:CubicO group peptidase (beta-lactamase class C family)